MKKNNLTWALAIIILSVIIGNAAAAAQDDKILIRTYVKGNNISLIEIKTIQNNNFYSGYYHGDFIADRLEFIIRLLDKDGKVLTEKKADFMTHTLIDFNSVTKNARKIKISLNNTVLVDKQIDFCNNNGICEFCYGANCTGNENEVSCIDCSASSKDDYCNVRDDDVCDPDCVPGYSYGEQINFTGCYETTLFTRQCKDYGYSQCGAKQDCKGTEIALANVEGNCCKGTCEDKPKIQEYESDIDQIEKSKIKGENYTWVFIAAGMIILIIALVYFVKKKNLITISMIALLLTGACFVALRTGSGTQVTGMATLSADEAKSIFPELFSYDSEKNQNLLIALKDISSEFSKENVEVTPELLAAMDITLEKEVGIDFLPSEEYGDYCAGPGCTYKINGYCRDSEYEGGCDYKGRGYIQITHKSGYEMFCGDDCLTTTKDECDCVGRAYCANQNCAPSKAMQPDVASRIFAQFYIYKDLVTLSNEKNYYEVGYRINGGESYGQDFETRANDKLSEMNQNKEGLTKFLAYLAGTYTPEQPEPTTTTVPGQPPVIENPPETSNVPQEIVTGDKIGFYYLNPSFRVFDSFNFSVYEKIKNEASEFQSEMHSCTGSIESCAAANKPSYWKVSCSSLSMICTIDADTGYKVFEYDKASKKYMDTPVIVKFALDFSTAPINGGSNEGICIDSPKTILVYGDSITAGASAYDYFQTEFDASSVLNGKVTMYYSGVVSETAAGSVDRLEEALAKYNPSIVLLWHGMNQGAGPSAYKQAYYEIIQTLLSKGITPVIVSPAYVCKETRRGWDPYFEELSAKIGELKNAPEFAGKVYVIDERQIMKTQFENGKACTDWYALDDSNPDLDYHPSNSGHSLIAKDIVKQFTDWNTPGSDTYSCSGGDDGGDDGTGTGTTALNCPADVNLNYFTVSDYTPADIPQWNWRYYSKCISGENSNVLKYINEGFEKYPVLDNAGYTRLLFMMECFAESKCSQSVTYQGFCAVVDCPSEYPECHDNTEEGKRQNILAAVKELSNTVDKLNVVKQRFGLNDRQLIELIIYTYNRGIGTVMGFDYKGDYLKGVTDYLDMDFSLEDAMLEACCNVYDAGVYGECGGSKNYCCSDVGGIGYVSGTIYEYENWLCPTVKKVNA